MGLIKERLRIAANYVGNKEIMKEQLDYAGEAIESEFDKLYEEVKKVQNQYELIVEMLEVKQIAFPDEPLGPNSWGLEVARLHQKIAQLSATVGKELKRQDKVIRASNIGIGHSLKKQNKKIIKQDEKIEELGRCNDQAHERLHLHSGRIEALEKEERLEVTFKNFLSRIEALEKPQDV